MVIAQEVEADIRLSDCVMSRFSDISEITSLNRRLGSWQQVSPRLYQAIAASCRAYRITGGRFDPRVLAHLEAIGYGGAELGPLVADKTGGAWCERRPRSHEVRLLDAIDLGGIGKGLAVRWASHLAQHRTDNHLLNAGGDLMLVGDGPDGTGWLVGVEDPDEPAGLLAALRLRGPAACCTSSVRRLSWLHDGERVHHLIDPATGQPGGEGLRSVTVVGRDAAWTEVLSKTLFLEGRKGITAAVRGRAVLFVDEDRAVFVTRSMASRLSGVTRAFTVI